MKKFFSEFKNFATKGNVVDMAVGVVVGGAFSKIVTSLVNNIISPLIGLATGGMDFGELVWVMKEAVTDADGVVVKEALTLNYGAFLQSVIDFLIIALSIFTVIRTIAKTREKLAAMNKKKLEEEAAEAAAAAEKAAQEAEEAKKHDPAVLLEEIRDLLKAQKQ